MNKNVKKLLLCAAVAFLFCLASCDNGSTQTTPGSAVSDIDYSLGAAPDKEPLSEDEYSAKENSDGIYLEFDIPKKTWQTRVYIEGIGQVAEQVWYNEDNTKGDFFFPFVEAEKKYTIRFVFLREEDKDEDDFVIDYIDGDGVIAWFETNVTAGANSKGEARIKDFGKVDAKKNGDFKFTRKLEFENEKVLTGSDYDWTVDIGLVDGISWNHGTERKTKWYESVEIERENITDTCNLFDMRTWSHGIDFICVRPIMRYKYGDKTYGYQWDSFVQDIYYPPKADSFETIDISNHSQVSKICGTWEFKTNWTSDDYKIYDSIVPMKINQTKTLTIDAQNIENKIIEAVTKKNGDAFTEQEKKFHIDNTYRLTKFSDDDKTMTQEWGEKGTLSEYFKDREYIDYTRHCELKLFEDNDLGNELRLVFSGKDKGQNYNFYDLYYKK